MVRPSPSDGPLLHGRAHLSRNAGDVDAAKSGNARKSSKLMLNRLNPDALWHHNSSFEIPTGNTQACRP